jgi:hypothetical protein
VNISCDTAEQAYKAAKMAARWLPQHQRLPLERVYDPEARQQRDELS